MTNEDLDKLVNHIDGLVNAFVSKREKASKPGQITDVTKVDISRLLDEGLYPPDDATSAPRLALLSVGETLGRIGGEALMHKVYDAYEAKHGASKANTLSARWDSAAGLWWY